MVSRSLHCWATLLYLNWQLTLVVAFIVPAVGWIMKTLSKRLYRITKSSQQSTDALAYVVEENVLAHRVVRLHGAQQAQAARFGDLSRQLRKLNIKSTIASAAMTPTTQLMAAVALSAVICIALWQGRSENVTVGSFVAFISAMLMLIAPLRRMADVANPITRGVAALERGSGFDGRQRCRAKRHPAPHQSARPYRRCGTSACLLAMTRPPRWNGVNLQVHPGEVLALVGPSGAGKTTW